MKKESNRIAVFHNLPGGGGIRMLENIMTRGLKNKKIDLFVIGENKPKKISCSKIYFFQVYPWKSFFLRNLWIIFILPKIHKQLAKIINNKYEFILLTHDYFTKSPYLLRYLKIRNAYLCQESQREFYESWKFHAPGLKNRFANILRYPIKIIDKTNVKYAKKIICNSKYSRKVLSKIYEKKCNLIYPGVDNRYFKRNGNTRKKMILCIGAINSVKDQIFLVKSLKPILRQYKLVLVGNGNVDYINKIYEAGGKNSNIEIFSHVSEKKLISLYQNSAVTCISAHKEPFGLSSIESQACGTPVVAVKEGGVIETIVDGKSGYLVSRNPKIFLKKVILVIKNQHRMGAHAYTNILENWTWETTLKDLPKYLQ